MFKKVNIIFKIVYALVELLFIEFYNTIKKKSISKKILIVKNDGLGDLILFVPFIRSIQAKHPEFKIVIIIQEFVREIRKNFDNNIKYILINNNKYKHNPFYRFRFGLHIHKENFYLAIYPRLRRDIIGDSLIFWSAAKKKISWDSKHSYLPKVFKKLNDSRYDTLIPSEDIINSHTFNQHHFFLKYINVPVSENKLIFQYRDIDIVKQLLHKYKITKNQYFVFISVASTGIRSWSLNNYCQLGDLLIKNYDIPIILVGSCNDRNNLEKISSTNSKIINMAGELPLSAMFYLFANAKAVIGNDTGLMHIAISCSKKTFCILGGGQYGEFMPYGDFRSNMFITSNDRHCFNCDWQCIYGDYRCLNDISIKRVYKTIQKNL